VEERRGRWFAEGAVEGVVVAILISQIPTV